MKRDDFDVFADLSEMWEAGGRERFTGQNGSAMAGNILPDCQPARGCAGACPCRHLLSSGEANQLFEMPESEQNARFVRFADFRRDPENHR